MLEQNLNSLYEQQLDLSDLTGKQRDILKAALELFSSQGFEATSTQQIAERAAVASGSVYKKFPNKEALLKAVLAPLFQAMPIVADEFVEQTLSNLPEEPRDFIEAIVRDRAAFVFENAQVLKLMLTQLLTDPVFADRVKSLFSENISRYIVPVLEDYKSQGKIKALTNEFMIQILLSSLAGYFGRIILALNPPDFETVVEELTEFLMSGLIA